MIFLHVIHFYFLFIQVFRQVNALNILTVFPYHGKSHFITFRPFIEELARRGHNVTVISYFPREKSLKNYHDLILSRTPDIPADEYTVERSYSSIVASIHFLETSGIENCNVMLQNKNVQQLWKSKSRFDVAIVEQFNSDCGLGLVYKLDAPVVGITSHSLMPYHYSRFGIPFNPSFVPFHFLEGGTKPTFFQRIERLIFHVYVNYRYSIGQKAAQNILAHYFDDVPPLEELARDIKILLVYTNNILFGSSLLPANVMEVQGYHVTEAQPLPEDLQTFLDNAPHGVIYISFGSVIRANSISPSMMKIIRSALSELPQKVVWKWEDASPPGNLQNIYFSKWLPQRDILAHKNVLAFYSHCGLGGTTEAVHFGVPIVGMPILGDQPVNAAAIEENGFGVQISLSELSKDLLLNKFKTVLDPEFRRSVKSKSKLWRDRPLSALENAVFWTEYAARHKHFQFRSAAADVPFYQYLFLDIAFLLLFLCMLIYFVIKYTFFLLMTRSNITTNKKTN